mmetsp:Transcript_28165/g.39329  ORF Transcript_28165/g.39329 Transcript_28165/m.39329 type:complete len:84 (-) Transcript_28165:10-261(-)
MAFGTPGRIDHLLRTRILRPSNVKMAVIDEAGEMLGQGLEEQICEIFEALRTRDVQVASMFRPPCRQMCCRPLRSSCATLKMC